MGRLESSNNFWNFFGKFLRDFCSSWIMFLLWNLCTTVLSKTGLHHCLLDLLASLAKRAPLWWKKAFKSEISDFVATWDTLDVWMLGLALCWMCTSWFVFFSLQNLKLWKPFLIEIQFVEIIRKFGLFWSCFQLELLGFQGSCIFRILHVLRTSLHGHFFFLSNSLKSEFS